MGDEKRPPDKKKKKKTPEDRPPDGDKVVPRAVPPAHAWGIQDEYNAEPDKSDRVAVLLGQWLRLLLAQQAAWDALPADQRAILASDTDPNKDNRTMAEVQIEMRVEAAKKERAEKQKEAESKSAMRNLSNDEHNGLQGVNRQLEGKANQQQATLDLQQAMIDRQQQTISDLHRRMHDLSRRIGEPLPVGSIRKEKGKGRAQQTPAYNAVEGEAAEDDVVPFAASLTERVVHQDHRINGLANKFDFKIQEQSQKTRKVLEVILVDQDKFEEAHDKLEQAQEQSSAKSKADHQALMKVFKTLLAIHKGDQPSELYNACDAALGEFSQPGPGWATPQTHETITPGQVRKDNHASKKNCSSKKDNPSSKDGGKSSADKDAKKK